LNSLFRSSRSLDNNGFQIGPGEFLAAYNTLAGKDNDVLALKRGGKRIAVHAAAGRIILMQPVIIQGDDFPRTVGICNVSLDLRDACVSIKSSPEPDLFTGRTEIVIRVASFLVVLESPGDDFGHGIIDAIKRTYHVSV
jgi:hypothetical protein